MKSNAELQMTGDGSPLKLTPPEDGVIWKMDEVTGIPFRVSAETRKILTLDLEESHAESAWNDFSHRGSEEATTKMLCHIVAVVEEMNCTMQRLLEEIQRASGG